MSQTRHIRALPGFIYFKESLTILGLLLSFWSIILCPNFKNEVIDLN